MRYFLLGTYGIDMFYREDYKSLSENLENWELVGFDDNKDDVTELLEHVIGWDAYLELKENEVEEINNAINLK